MIKQETNLVRKDPAKEPEALRNKNKEHIELLMTKVYQLTCADIRNICECYR